MKKFFEDIYYFFYRKGMYRPSLIENTKAFFYWGWKMKDKRWWDSGFLMEVMADYFKYMADNFTDEQTHIVGWAKVQKELKICAHLCQRMTKEDYTTPWDHVEPKWKTKELPDGNCLRTKSFNTEWEDKLLRKKYARQVELYKQDMHMLTNLMRRKFDKWWD